MDTEKKLAVLSKIAEKLNGENVTWAVGASLLLYFKGKTDHFNDIDLMVMEEDIPKLKRVFLSMGALLPSEPNDQYRTRCFLEFEIEDVEVDVMAGLILVNNHKEYDCSLRKEEIKEWVTVHSQKVPLHSLERWKRYYELMGRKEKAEMISKESAAKI